MCVCLSVMAWSGMIIGNDEYLRGFVIHSDMKSLVLLCVCRSKLSARKGLVTVPQHPPSGKDALKLPCLEELMVAHVFPTLQC